MLQSEALGLLVWSPLAGGLLSGKYTRAQPEVAGSRRATFAFPPVEVERGYDVIDALVAMATRKGSPWRSSPSRGSCTRRP
jgi:aryl-alcohol dehydrogenase-like predicted oxidoreductase